MSNDNVSSTQNQAPLTNADEIVTSWRDIDASTPEGLRELNAVIARRRGFQVVELNSIHPVFRWILVDANGQLYYECKPHFEGFNARRSAKEAFEMDAPAYTTDANAAFSLFADIRDIRLIVDYVIDDEWRVGYGYNGMRYLPGSGSYYPLPEAICRAWLTWSDAQAAAAGGKREAGE